jgi:hypothetical protein
MDIISDCRQDFLFSESKVDTWFELLIDIPVDIAVKNLKEHLRTSEHIPTPASITGYFKTGHDKEIELRNADLAFIQYVNEGGDPYVYGNGTGYKKLGG